MPHPEPVSHLDGDRLVLLALGDEEPTAQDRAHLDTCADCADELRAMTELATAGREAREVEDLPAPPARVWDRIAASTVDVPEPVIPRPRRVVPPTAPRWARTVVVAVAAALVAIAGTVGVVSLVRRGDDPAVTAQTSLVAYGDTPPAAHGTAELLDDRGRPALRVRVADLPSGPGYYEVWLINPNNLQMISIGVLGGRSDGTFPLPSTVEIKDYTLVDVSAELYDGVVTHSGHSLLRGSLNL